MSGYRPRHSAGQVWWESFAYPTLRGGMRRLRYDLYQPRHWRPS